MSGPSPEPARLTGDADPDLGLLFGELVRLETELWSAVETRLRSGHGIVLPTFQFLQVISRQPRCRVHDIATELSITVGGTSKIVDRMEAAGLCARRANPGDRRSSIISLTPAGRQMLAGATATVDDELRLRLGQVPARSLAQLIRTLTGLRMAMRTAGDAEQSA